MNKNAPIEHAFITAAGLGERMRPLTNDRCKPMVEVAGQPIIGHVLDRLVAAGIKYVGVNSFYKPDNLEAYLQQYGAAHPGLTITIVREDILLNTGGGIKNALSTMPDAPFFVISGDSFWDDDPSGAALDLMAQHFNPATTDIMLLLKDLNEMHPTEGSADYDIDNNRNLTRSPTKTGAYAWTSIRIIKNKTIFDNTPDTPFSFLELLDRAQAVGKLQGLLHAGAWHHFSTPADIMAVNNYVALQKKILGTEELPLKRAPTFGI